MGRLSSLRMHNETIHAYVANKRNGFFNRLRADCRPTCRIALIIYVRGTVCACRSDHGVLEPPPASNMYSMVC